MFSLISFGLPCSFTVFVQFCHLFLFFFLIFLFRSSVLFFFTIKITKQLFVCRARFSPMWVLNRVTIMSINWIVITSNNVRSFHDRCSKLVVIVTDIRFFYTYFFIFVFCFCASLMLLCLCEESAYFNNRIFCCCCCFFCVCYIQNCFSSTILSTPHYDCIVLYAKYWFSQTDNTNISSNVSLNKQKNLCYIANAHDTFHR